MTILLRLSLLLSLFITGCAQLNNLPLWSGVSVQRAQNIDKLPAVKQVALLLPLSGSLGESGQAVRSGFMAANLNAHKNITVNSYDTNRQDPRLLYQQAVNNGAELVIGPLTKANVELLQKQATFNIPTLALNSVETKQALPANFYVVDLSPQSEAEQAATKAYQDGYRSALIISPAGAWGDNVSAAFRQQWLKLGGMVADSLAYQVDQDLTAQLKQILQFRANSSDEKGSAEQLFSQRRQDVDVILLNATPEAARQIRPLLKFYYAGNLPVYATAQVYTGTPMPLADRDLDGIKFPDMPWIIKEAANESAAYQQIIALTPTYNKRYARLYALGLDAYLFSQQFAQINQGIAGYAGVWSIDTNNHRLTRRLTWAQFQDGKPVSLEP